MYVSSHDCRTHLRSWVVLVVGWLIEGFVDFIKRALVWLMVPTHDHTSVHSIKAREESTLALTVIPKIMVSYNDLCTLLCLGGILFNFYVFGVISCSWDHCTFLVSASTLSLLDNVYLKWSWHLLNSQIKVKLDVFERRLKDISFG